MNKQIGSDISLLSDDDLAAVSGGQQVFKHEFPGAVNQLTGLRPFEPKMPPSPDPEGGLNAYGSTDNNLPG
jgi:hypothetical protein